MNGITTAQPTMGTDRPASTSSRSRPLPISLVPARVCCFCGHQLDGIGLSAAPIKGKLHRCCETCHHVCVVLRDVDWRGQMEA